MSANFYNYIQPSIIKCGDTENIPENLRNKFMININIAAKAFGNNTNGMEM